jgi:Glyoxalase-like domain
MPSWSMSAYAAGTPLPRNAAKICQPAVVLPVPAGPQIHSTGIRAAGMTAIVRLAVRRVDGIVPCHGGAMASIHDVVFDCRHPAALARFWAAALDDYAVAPYDEAELARLRDAGVSDPEDDPTVLVEGPAGRPRPFFQLVPEPRTVKNRVHLDLRGHAVEAELDRLSALGALILAEYDSHIVLADPEGNEFCLSQRPI